MTVTQHFERNEQTQKVVLDKGKKPSFGICIVRGEVKDSPSTKVSGIFIKEIVPQSPAHSCGKLKIGDRILRLNGKDVKDANEETVINLIRVAGQIISLDIQTFDEKQKTSNGPVENGHSSNSAQKNENSVEKSNTSASAKTSNTTSSSNNAVEDDDDEEDTRDLAGRMYTAAGYEIDRASAGNVKRSRGEAESDPEKEDEFGYTMKKIKKRWGNLGNVIKVEVKRPPNAEFGIALLGHKDRQQMETFIGGVRPEGLLGKSDVKAGDQILEVNGNVLSGRCHLNASVIFNNLPGDKVVFILLRHSKTTMCIPAIKYFPPVIDEIEYLLTSYRNVKQIQIQKNGPIGIMIIQGKHVEIGDGIFVSDLQAESPAEQAGIMVGDVLLAVNKNVLVDTDYDTAAGVLKRAKGVVTLILARLKSEEEIKKEQEEKEKEEKRKEEARKEAEKPHDPAVDGVKLNKKTLIEIKPEKKPFGVVVCGGRNAFTTTGVVITHVYPDGVLGKDGRIHAFDQILDINGTPLNVKEFSQLKCHQFFHLPYDKVNLQVYRADPPETETVTVEIMRKPGKDLGMNITAGAKGAVITEIVPCGNPDVEGKLQRGDTITKINGESLEEATFEQIFALFRQASGKITFEVLRPKPKERT